MTLTELKYIVAVAREHHFGRAAEACSSASPRCRWPSSKLEDELDVTLFERSGTEVGVTPLGQQHRARRRRSVLDQARQHQGDRASRRPRPAGRAAERWA